ncbi:MAG: hypothetical protein HYV68_02040 [Candidatus Taylorbacteria bacterium]|nr:hypothetical protein [Candidatus Taylorbacteria bacterium]
MADDKTFDQKKFEQSLSEGKEAEAASHLEEALKGSPDVKEQARFLLADGLADIAVENELNEALIEDMTGVRERLQKLRELKQMNEEMAKADQIREELG